MDLPSHPDIEGDSSESGHGPPRNRALMIALWVLAAVVVIVIVLHLTGIVGPLAH